MNSLLAYIYQFLFLRGDISVLGFYSFDRWWRKRILLLFVATFFSLKITNFSVNSKKKQNKKTNKKKNTFDIYADDTTLSLGANWNNITSLTQALSNDMENIEKWSTENKMYINTEKTKALLVMGKRLQHKLSEETATSKLLLDATNMIIKRS